MEFQTLKKNNFKKYIIIGVFIITIISTIILNFTRAKYRTTQSIPLINGTINYSLADLNIVAIYQENDNDEYENINEVPISGYKLNENESYCEVNNIKQDNIIINYNSITKNLKISPMTFKDTKCYLYFDKSNLFYDKLLADNPTRLTRTDFSTPLETENTGTLYTVGSPWIEEFEGSLNTVYYFAGNALNNWVKFAGFYWRIIRTNEDGSIRLLYSGTSQNTETGYILKTSINSSYNNAIYVGYMYGTTGSLETNRTNTNNSNIKNKIDTWYSDSLLTKSDTNGNNYDNYISRTAIYCNDRSTDNNYSSYSLFYYASSNRNASYHQPSYKCGNNQDGKQYNDANNADKFSSSKTNGGNGILTYPVALMTADEVVYAGGVFGYESKAWYYYNSIAGSITSDYYWWTMSPFHVATGGNSDMFSVCGYSSPGYLHNDNVNRSYAVRPVISLKSCVEWLDGNGSSDNPYELNISSSCANAEN